MRRTVPILALGLLLTGCGVSQIRGDYSEHLSQDAVNRETALHGPVGYEIAEIYESDGIKRKRLDYSGQRRGFSVTEFWQVEIASDPNRPSKLSQAGFFHKLKDGRSNDFMYEFFTEDWDRIAYLVPNGDLYDLTGTKRNILGKFQLDGAVQKLYPAPNGYGYDRYKQDKMTVMHHDLEVASLDPKDRGVSHNGHKARPAIWVYTPLNGDESLDRAERYRKSRAYEGYDMTAKRLKEKKFGDSADGEYGGLEYKDGHPVDENGRRISPKNGE